MTNSTILTFSGRSRSAGLLFFPIATAILMLTVSAGLIVLPIVYAPVEPEALFFIAVALFIMKPHQHLLILGVALLPIRDRSEELVGILGPVLEETLARLALAGHQIPDRANVQVGFDTIDAKGVAHLNISSSLEPAAHRAVCQALQKALIARTRPHERMKMAVRTFSATLRLPDPILSNHKLMEVAARNRSA